MCTIMFSSRALCRNIRAEKSESLGSGVQDEQSQGLQTNIPMILSLLAY